MRLGFKRKTPRQGQKKSNSFDEARKRSNERIDSMYAILRRIDDRVKQLEIESSTLRRDVNRCSRKLYREEPDLTVSKTPVTMTAAALNKFFENDTPQEAR